jgi:hypothetical protein
LSSLYSFVIGNPVWFRIIPSPSAVSARLAIPI